MAEVRNNGLHNTARQRLARAVTPHPDADLLAAFAEGGLRGTERDQVLTHLSACADCREVVVLAQPEEAEAATVAEVAPTRTWVSWYRLRWGAVALSLVIVAGAVLLYRQGGEQQFQAPPTSTAPKTAEKSLPTANQVPPSPPTTTMGEHGRAGKLGPAQPVVTARKDEEKPALDGLADKAKKETRGQPGSFSSVNGALAGVPPPAKNAVTPAPTGGVIGGVGGGAYSAKTTPSAPPAPPPATSTTVEVAAEPTQVTTTNGPKSTTVDASAQNSTINVNAESSVVQNDATGARNERQKIQKQDNAYIYSQPVLRDNTTANAKMRPATPHWQWRVTDAGLLQRSTDAKHWQAMPLNTGVHFLAVVASGTEVWAGGSGGALYRSTDDGAHWNKVALDTTADVKGLTFTAPNHVLVTTSAGTQAVSETQH